jgi:hypothetical protein
VGTKDLGRQEQEALGKRAVGAALIGRENTVLFSKRWGNVLTKSMGVTMFSAFEATREDLGSDEGGQACTGANS